MKVKAHFKAPLWSVIRIEIGWSWWKRVYKYLLLVSAWWCDNGRWGGGCIPLQEKPRSIGMASCWESCDSFSSVEDGQFWGKSPLKWIFPEAGRLGGAVISMALQNLWFCIYIPAVMVAATEKLWFLHCIGKVEQPELSISVTQANIVTLWTSVATVRSHLCYFTCDQMLLS